MKPNAIVRYLALNTGLLVLLLLILLSVAGAFLGADKAALFFNAPPLAVFWGGFLAVLAAGLVWWRSLRRRPSLLLCHLGCVLVLAGGLWGAPAAHRLRERMGFSPSLIKGEITLYEGQSGTDVLIDRSQERFCLPFTVHLTQAAVTYYDRPSLGVYTTRGESIGRMPAVADGTVYELSAGGGVSVQVVRRFENLRLVRQDDGIVGAEGDPAVHNPAYEVAFSMPDGSTLRQYVFERFEPHFTDKSPFITVYIAAGMPQEYTSTLVLKNGGQVLSEKTIRVNDPLYYGGYHFYQSRFGQDEHGTYSGILVVSDRGVWCVFAGYGMMMAGLVGQFWLRPLLRRRKETA